MASGEHLADGDCRVDSVHAWHHHVGDQVFKAALLRELKAMLAGLYTAVAQKTADVEDHCECVGVVGIVINDENFRLDGFQGVTVKQGFYLSPALILTPDCGGRGVCGSDEAPLVGCEVA